MKKKTKITTAIFLAILLVFPYVVLAGIDSFVSAIEEMATRLFSWILAGSLIVFVASRIVRGTSELSLKQLEIVRKMIYYSTVGIIFGVLGYFAMKTIESMQKGQTPNYVQFFQNIFGY